MAPQEELLTVSTTSCTDSQSRLSLKTSLRSSDSAIWGEAEIKGPIGADQQWKLSDKTKNDLIHQ